MSIVRKRILTIVFSVLAVIIFAFACYILVGVIIAEKSGKPYQYFGYSLHVVATDSMSPELSVGDMVFVQSVDISTVKVGDDVTFKSPIASHNGMDIIHRVIEVNIDGDKISLTTQGIKEGAAVDPITVSEIGGVCRNSSQLLGKIYLMLTTPSGLILLVVIMVAAAVIIRMIRNIFKSSKSDEED